MSEGDAISFYVQRIADTARTMPLRDAAAFLQGALCLAGEHDAVAEVRTTYYRICESDAQLELIASGQMRLPLTGEGAR
jgi:hypothetical protein